MKLKSLRIVNYRCFEDVHIEVGSMHALVGANNAGKSTILKALDFLLNPSPKKINEESFCRNRTNSPIEVEALFHELTDAERAHLKSYLRLDGLFHLKRTATLSEQGAAVEGGDEDKINIFAHYCKPLPRIEWLDSNKIAMESINAWWKEKENLTHGGHNFVSILEDKKPNVSVWKEKAAEFAAAYLEETDFEPVWTASPTGFLNVLKATLPHYVLIPAVRYASEESKVTKGSPFGRLIYEIMNGMDIPFRSALAAQLKETTRVLNREGKDQRSAEITEVENTIKGYLAELMPVDLEIEFQAPTVDVLLTTPRIVIHDGFRGSIEGKGHGLQRAVIFAILRAYAKLVTQVKGKERRTLILGVEEPELYMHPTAQRATRTVLRSIADGGDQVIFSTHSPLLVDVSFFDEIIRCENPASQGAGEHGSGRRFQLSMADIIKDIESRSPKLKGKITDKSVRVRYSHAYSPSRNEGFFAKKIILVEGQTELYALPLYAQAMGHDLDALSIGVVECGSKANINMLYRVFNELGIGCFVLFDFDRDNKDKKRVEESRKLLNLLGAPDIEKPEAPAIESNYAYFVHVWEKDLESEIPNYQELKEAGKQALGLELDSKPLLGRYVATRLVSDKPPTIPETLRAIIERAICVEYKGSCLHHEDAQN
jgi:putative ATP-dependent endonuclease of the OLD family